jgi:DNA (cytosine-5)-methyltransferase 1
MLTPHANILVLPAVGSARNSNKSKSQNIRNAPVQFPDQHVRFARLYDGTTVKVGDNVELLNSREDSNQELQSGDFMRVNHIIRDTSTDEVRLRGLKFVRSKYLEPVFDCRFSVLLSTNLLTKFKTR